MGTCRQAASHPAKVRGNLQQALQRTARNATSPGVQTLPRSFPVAHVSATPEASSHLFSTCPVSQSLVAFRPFGPWWRPLPADRTVDQPLTPLTWRSGSAPRSRDAARAGREPAGPPPMTR
eukprot:4729366-Pyramimonas_sp.AAC.1